MIFSDNNIDSNSTRFIFARRSKLPPKVTNTHDRPPEGKPGDNLSQSVFFIISSPFIISDKAARAGELRSVLKINNEHQGEKIVRGSYDGARWWSFHISYRHLHSGDSRSIVCDAIDNRKIYDFALAIYFRLDIQRFERSIEWSSYDGPRPLRKVWGFSLPAYLDGTEHSKGPLK